MKKKIPSTVVKTRAFKKFKNTLKRIILMYVCATNKTAIGLKFQTNYGKIIYS